MMFSERERDVQIKLFNRTLKAVKKSEFYFDCIICNVVIAPTSLFIVDTRNDKYCSECANKILDLKIDNLQVFKKGLCNESILNELEEEDEG